MKNKIYLILIITLTLLIGGCFNKKVETKDVKCGIELLLKEKTRNIYTYCFGKDTVKIDNKKYNLSDYIQENSDTLDKLMELMIHEDDLDDGGTIIYKGDNFHIIKCHTLNGNNDIYIEGERKEFKEEFCK